MALTALSPTDTRFFFRPVASELVSLLRSLPTDAWKKSTVAGTWRVRDVVAHLVDVGMRRLSFHRDRHEPPAPAQPPRTEREFVAFINLLNAQWVDLARRISPRMLTDLYELVGLALADFTESFPIDGPALFPVSWAGEEKSEGWFDLGREFTEIWHHQAQIRDAVGAPPLQDPAWLHAMLLIALRGLPHAYRQVQAPIGESVTIEITGAAGGVWTLRRDDHRWTLWTGMDERESARVTMTDDTAWRLLFNALPPERVSHFVTTSGRSDMFTPLLRARSVIV
jgi:mycothiol maleylpyruvate isomerase-like protein